MKTKTAEQYVQQKGNHCPVCDSCDHAGGAFEVAAGTATQEVTCNDCGASWNDQYTLTGFDLVEED